MSRDEKVKLEGRKRDVILCHRREKREEWNWKRKMVKAKKALYTNTEREMGMMKLEEREMIIAKSHHLVDGE